ncbi:MAG: D-alanyl-D-alanine carboxypeptidase family protein [Alphaproteobacteria bacterium]|nr:D-alanyl-D-alanine carboxypeptidase family protein [Alphaproteobacteria bacterium]
MRRLLGFTFALLAFANISFSSMPALAKYASIILDAETGEIFHEVNADTRNHPASLTKIMTLYMLFDAVERGEVTLNTPLKVSRKASRQRPSKLGLRAGSTITVENAILALVTKSANDVAVVVAEALGGTESDFATKMTNKAHDLGMKNTFFKNASGLHKRGQLSSARDMAKLGIRIRKDFPQFYEYFSTWKFKYLHRTYYNHNKLLRYYEGTDGIKTGFTNASGFNLVASVERHGRRLIGVVFGGRTSKSRNAHMQKLLDKGYRKVLIASLRPAPRPELIKNNEGKLVPLSNQPLSVALLTQNPAAPYMISGTTSLQATPALATQLKPVQVAEAMNTSKDAIDDDATSPSQLPLVTRAKTLSQKGKIEDTKDIPDIWSVQVGAYSKKRNAHQAAGLAAVHVRYVSSKAEILVQEIGNMNKKLYRARLTGLNEQEAKESCTLLKSNNLNCLIVAPETPGQIASSQP